MTEEFNQSPASSPDLPSNSDNQPINKLPGAEQIVSRNWKWASGAGLVPLPLVDILGATAIQLKMLNELCIHYDVKFSRNLGKSAIGALLGMISNIGAASLGSLVKLIPAVGTTLGMVAQPVFFGAATYAMGRVFIQHFETGGNLLTLDAQAMKEYFKEQFEAGKLVVKEDLTK